MMRLTSYIRIFLFIVASTIFLSCNESNIGIFYGIETEVKLVDNSLSNDLTIGSMARDDAGILYIGTGRVYAKNTGEWYKLSTPSGFDLSTSIASANGVIYAVFFNIDGTKKGLFKLGNDNSSWTKVDTSSFNGSVERVKSANNVLFVSTRISENVGKLYYLNENGDTFNKILKLRGSDFHVTHNGTTYWIASWNHTYIYTNNNLRNTPLSNSIDIERNITSLTPGFSSDYIYFSVWRVNSTSREGYIYALNNTNNISEKDDIDYVINGIKCFKIGEHSFILAATAGRGYFYHEFYQTPPNFYTGGIDLERSKSNNALAQNYTSATDIHYSVALNFFAVNEPIGGGIASGGDLYLLTVNSGLWKNSESGGSRTWSVE